MVQGSSGLSLPLLSATCAARGDSMAFSFCSVLSLTIIITPYHVVRFTLFFTLFITPPPPPSEKCKEKCKTNDVTILPRRGPQPGLSLIHISEPTRLRRISYAVFCLKKKKT